MRYVECASTSDLEPAAMTGVEVDGEQILLANAGGTYRAIQRKCPHMGADLCKGRLDGDKLTCRMHGAVFDVATGEAVGKAKLLLLRVQPKPARTYPVKVEGDQVLIGV